MKSGNLVVRHHSPWRHRLQQFFLFLFVIGAGAGLFFYGQYKAGFDIVKANQFEQQLQQKIDALELDKSTLRDELALAQRSTQVDEQAYIQVKENLKSLQQEILELQEEVGFYRGIVAPREASAGLHIERFDLEKQNASGLYRYNFVLTQVLKNHKSVRGLTTLSIVGVQNDRPKTLSLKSVSASKTKHHEFKFRYFQKFEGDIVIPKNFTPKRVLIEVDPRKQKKISSEFPWPGAESVAKNQS